MVIHCSFCFVFRKSKKRKRIRAQKSDDSSDDDDDDDHNNSKKGRKNIRKVIKLKDLDLDTKQAAREEQERKKRIEDRQKIVRAQMFMGSMLMLRLTHFY